MALATSSLAVHDDGLLELDKNTTNDLNTSKLGELGTSATAGSLTLNVCQTAASAPTAPFTILVEAERMTVTADATGNWGGNCANKRTYTVTRGAGGTTPTAHAKGGVDGYVSLLVDAPAKPGTDWNQVYASVTADANDMGDDDKCIALGLVECAFIEDGIGPTTFIGGSTKDHLPVSGWNHTSGASPDKAEILNAYAAKGLSGSNQILYFGMDRYAVDGSTDIGFWFFKNPVVANPDGTFTGDQAVNDILILGTFTQGGAASDIRVFKWVGTGGNESGTIQGPDAAFGDCVPGSAGDNGCATVNDTSVQVPWNYTFKGSAKSGWVPAGGGFEGGVDLTALGLDGCFSSFLAETRSSPEITAILKDFALGSFEACGSTLTTTPGDGTSSGTALTDSNTNGLPDISIGTGTVAVKDRATLNVTGISTWSGSLSFFLCGPLDAPATCSTGGVPIGSPIAVTNATSQPVLSPAANLTSVGRYCWRGDFTSSTTGVPNASDSSLGECFEVLPVTPALDTQAVASAVDFGQAVQDNATLANTATQPGTNGGFEGNYLSINATNGAAAGGKITFTLLKNDCSALATGTGTNPQDFTPISGDGTYGPVSFTPDAPGTYHWKAQYVPATGDPNNIGSIHNLGCTDTDETVVVNQVPSSVTTRQSVFPQDKAEITATGGGNLAGTLRFTLHDDLTECQGRTDIKYDSGNISISGASPQTGATNNTTYRIVDNTTHYWNVSYVSTNPAHLGSSSECVETTTVTYVGNDTGISLP
jgi:hypothetical protein